jgi:hypothetical protein
MANRRGGNLKQRHLKQRQGNGKWGEREEFGPPHYVGSYGDWLGIAARSEGV